MRKKILNLIILLIILWGFGSVNWTGELIHAGGAATAKQIMHALLSPDFSGSRLQDIFASSVLTISYAVAGMSVSIALAFILGIIASGVLSPEKKSLLSKSIRSLLTFMRSIHELIWAWLFVAAFGLHPLSAILALGIPYGGTLGRIFADMLEDVPKKPVEAIENAGGNRLQALFYVYFPYALPNMISYGMYRFECAVRASVIMSFVGLGGLGYKIQLNLGDLEYNAAFSYLYGLVILIVLIELWSNRLRFAMQAQSLYDVWVKRFSIVFALFATAGAWRFIQLTDGLALSDLFNEKNAAFTLKFFRSLIGIGEDVPAFLDKSKWMEAILASITTMQMSVLAIVLAAFFAVWAAIFAAQPKEKGNNSLLGLGRKIIFYMLRSIFIVSRAVPELIWAMVFVFLFKPGPLPGVLALAVHNFGILGKLCAEVVENMDDQPLSSLKSSGANNLQILIYGVLPLTLPGFLTFILYRWEVIIRTTILVGFVGAGGLGQAFKLSMSWFHYSDITLYLLCYLIMIGLVDHFAQYLRKHIL